MSLTMKGGEENNGMKKVLEGKKLYKEILRFCSLKFIKNLRDFGF